MAEVVITEPTMVSGIVLKVLQTPQMRAGIVGKCYKTHECDQYCVGSATAPTLCPSIVVKEVLRKLHAFTMRTNKKISFVFCYPLFNLYLEKKGALYC